MRVERTKKGHPAIWEEGGASRNTGHSVIVAGENGSPRAPVYVRRRGHLAGGRHALFIVRPGAIVVSANQHRGDFEIAVSRIERIDGDEAILAPVCKYDRGEWDSQLPGGLKAAVRAAVVKATCYHCRSLHYALADGEAANNNPPDPRNRTWWEEEAAYALREIGVE